MIVKFEHSIAAMDRWSKLFQVTNKFGQYKYRATSPVGVTFCGQAADGFIAMGSQRPTSWLELPFLDYKYKNKLIGSTKNLKRSILAFYIALHQQPYYGRFHLAFETYGMLRPDIWFNKELYPCFDKWLEIYKLFNTSRLLCNPFTKASGIDSIAFADKALGAINAGTNTNTVGAVTAAKKNATGGTAASVNTNLKDDDSDSEEEESHKHQDDVDIYKYFELKENIPENQAIGDVNIYIGDKTQ